MSEEGEKLELPAIPLEEREVIQDQPIWLPGFVKERSAYPNLLYGFWFVRCDLTGPVVISPQRGVNFLSFKVRADLTPKDVLFPLGDEPRKLQGVLIVEQCAFDDCRLIDVGITGGPSVLGVIERGWPRTGSQ